MYFGLGQVTTAPNELIFGGLFVDTSATVGFSVELLSVGSLYPLKKFVIRRLLQRYRLAPNSFCDSSL
jgi:hypothetical protein